MPMQGFYNSCEDGHIESFADLTKAKLEGKAVRSDFKGKANSATSLVRAAVSQNKQPVAIVMNLASRYITSPDNIDQSEVDSFTNLLLASMEGKDVRTENGTLKNLVVMVVNKVNDVPAWFYLAKRTADCVGLVKGYCWFDPEAQSIGYAANGMPDIATEQMIEWCDEKGSISTMPEIPGLLLWMDGHVGIYIGDGYAIEAMGTRYGVVKTRVVNRNWTGWCKSPYITYVEGETEGAE